jgi:hypothetical protein
MESPSILGKISTVKSVYFPNEYLTGRCLPPNTAVQALEGSENDGKECGIAEYPWGDN